MCQLKKRIVRPCTGLRMVSEVSNGELRTETDAGKCSSSAMKTELVAIAPGRLLVSAGRTVLAWPIDEYVEPRQARRRVQVDMAARWPPYGQPEIFDHEGGRKRDSRRLGRGWQYGAAKKHFCGWTSATP